MDLTSKNTCLARVAGCGNRDFGLSCAFFEASSSLDRRASRATEVAGMIQALYILYLIKSRSWRVVGR